MLAEQLESRDEAIVRRHGAERRLVALRRDAAPHDIGSLARYGPALAADDDAGLPFEPLSITYLIAGLRATPADDGTVLVRSAE